MANSCPIFLFEPTELALLKVLERKKLIYYNFALLKTWLKGSFKRVDCNEKCELFLQKLTFLDSKESGNMPSVNSNENSRKVFSMQLFISDDDGGTK